MIMYNYIKHIIDTKNARFFSVNECNFFAQKRYLSNLPAPWPTDRAEISCQIKWTTLTSPRPAPPRPRAPDRNEQDTIAMESNVTWGWAVSDLFL